MAKELAFLAATQTLPSVIWKGLLKRRAGKKRNTEGTDVGAVKSKGLHAARFLPF
jgi:hypothetical protein